MKTIIFVRHGNAKSGKEDLKRSLSKRGEKQAKERATELSEVGLSGVDLVISSTATRAQETAKLVFGANSWDIDPELYTACMAEGIAEAYAKLGASAPPMEWIKKYPRLWAVCVQHAAETKKLIEKCAYAETTAIVAHGTILNAVAVEFVGDVALKKLILEFAFPEGGAIAIRNRKVVSFHV